jgi:hypothetical protein
MKTIALLAAAASVCAASSPLTSISRPLTNPWYGHGGGMGFGPALLDDSTWSSIMRQLMPTEYADCTRKSFSAADTMSHFENNPVGAAYAYESTRVRCGSSGTAQSGCSPDVVTQGFEWDLFLRPDATSSNPMVDDILVAHGVGSKHLRKEQQGISQYYAVKAIKKTEMGGVLLSQWITLFTRALWMARNPSSASSYASRSVSWSDFATAYASGQPAGRSLPMRVVLDVKTGAASLALVRAVIRDLNSKGVIVSGVGSFDRTQIVGVESVVQSAGSLSNVRALPVIFYHGLRQRSIALLFGISALPPQFLDDVDAGNLPRGVGVAFNAGFLIDYNAFLPGSLKRKSYELDTGSVSEIAAAKSRYGLHIGVYVQEPDMDRWALQIIFDAVRQSASTFDLGFAWGGQASKWYTEIEPSLTDATVGTSSQSLLSSRVARVPVTAESAAGSKAHGPSRGLLIGAAAAAAATLTVAAAVAGVMAVVRMRRGRADCDAELAATPFVSM